MPGQHVASAVCSMRCRATFTLTSVAEGLEGYGRNGVTLRLSSCTNVGSM